MSWKKSKRLSITYFMIGTQGVFSPSQAWVRIFPFRANQKMRDRKTVLLFSQEDVFPATSGVAKAQKEIFRFF